MSPITEPAVPTKVLVTPIKDYRSRTIWGAALYAALHLIPTVKDFASSNPELQAILTSVGVILLRYITKAPLSSTVEK